MSHVVTVEQGWRQVRLMQVVYRGRYESFGFLNWLISAGNTIGLVCDKKKHLNLDIFYQALGNQQEGQNIFQQYV